MKKMKKKYIQPQTTIAILNLGENLMMGASGYDSDDPNPDPTQTNPSVGDHSFNISDKGDITDDIKDGDACSKGYNAWSTWD
jgi:hypothetical protein